MTVRSLSEVFLPGAAELPERLRTLSVTPTRFVEPGTTVEATFGFYNSGGATATGLRVRFAQPEGLQYIPNSAKIDGVAQTTMPDGAFIAATGALLGEIGPGVERRVSVLYRVADFIEDGTTLVVQAALAANETMIVGSNIVRLVARSRPLLLNPQTIVTLEAPAGAEPGRELLVRAKITNSGQSSANDVVLVFPVPEHTRYSVRTARVDGRLFSDDRQAPFDAATATVVAERLAPGQSVTADFITTIESPLDNGTLIAAGARVSAREIPEFEIRSNEVLVASMPSFDGDGTALVINGDSEVVPGMRLRMEMRASNVGTSSARRVIAQVTLPAGLVYSPGSATLDGLPIGDDLFESMSYAFDAIAPGRAVHLAFDAVVASPAPPDAKLPVLAKLSWENGERNFTRTLTIRSEPKFTRAKNVVERGGAPVAQPGENVNFIIRILNEGTAAASEARVIVRGDATLTVVSAQSNNRQIQMVENALVLGSIPPHVEQVVTVTTRIASPLPDKTEVTFGAEISTAQLGVMDLGVASYAIRSKPRFLRGESVLERLSPEPLRPSRPAEILVRVINSGTDTARDVRVILQYPPELTISGIDNAPLVKNELVFEAIAPGVTREAKIQAALAHFVPNGSVISLEGRIEAAELSPVPLNIIQIETRAEAEFAGQVQLLATPADAVDAGAPLQYTLVFRNVGDGPAQSIVVRGRQPENLIYVPASTSVNGMRADDENGTSPLWSLHGLILTDVDPGVPVEVRWNSVVTSPIASGTMLEAQATLEWDEQSLTAVAGNVTVRSNPEFASSPGGRSISIARLSSQAGFDKMRIGNDEPMQLARPRPVDVSRLDAIPAEFTAPPVAEAIFNAPPSTQAMFDAPPGHVAEALEISDTADENDLPFFSPPPSADEPLEAGEDPSSFAFVEPPSDMPQFGEPPARESELEFSAPAPVISEPEFQAPPAPAQAQADEQPVPEVEDVRPEIADDHAGRPFILEPLGEDAVQESERAAAVAEAVAPALEPALPALIEMPHTVAHATTNGPVSVLAFAPDRLRRTLSFLQQSDYGKLVSHLFALEAFFPDRIIDQPELDDLFVGVRDAFRSTLDKLFVRLRLPRYAIAARDLEDRSSREAVITLSQRVAGLEAVAPSHALDPVAAGIRICGPIEHESLAHALEALSDAPLGGVTPWIACVSLLGTTVETPNEAVAVLGEYRDALLTVLRVLESLPMSEFHRVLTNSSNAELDHALKDVVRVLGGPVEAHSR